MLHITNAFLRLKKPPKLQKSNFAPDSATFYLFRLIPQFR